MGSWSHVHKHVLSSSVHAVLCHKSPSIRMTHDGGRLCLLEVFVRLRRVQQRHLRAILRVPYTDRITNDQILDRAGVPDIEMVVRKMQLRWAGHVARMSDDRIPKQLLFGELTTGTRTVGRSLRSTWRRTVHDGLMLYDDSRRERNVTKRARRHAARNATTTASQDAYMCRHCGRTCISRIGILSHERACQKQRGRDT